MPVDTIKNVHTEHCCIKHGCKYGDDDCTVVTRRAPQSYVCESCSEYDGITDLNMLNLVMENKIKVCQHCGHVNP